MEKRIIFKSRRNLNLELQAWLRFLALVLDVYMIQFLIRLLFSSFFDRSVPIISILIYFIYSSLMEASVFQATLGKWFVGFRISDYHHNRISLRNSVIRNFAKIVSFISIFGFLMIDGNRKRQALHDIISKTLVIRRYNRS